MSVRIWCVYMQDQKVCTLKQKGKCACSSESEDNVPYSAGDLLFKYFPGPQTIKDSKSGVWWTAYLHQAHCNGFRCFLMRLRLIFFVISSVVDCAGWRSAAAALIFTHTHTRRSRRHSVAPTDSPYPWKRSSADAVKLVIDFGLEEIWHAVMGYWLNHLGCMDTQGCRTRKVNRVRPAFQRKPQKKKQEAEMLSKWLEAMHLHHIPNMCNLQLWQQFCHVMTVYILKKMMYLCKSVTAKPFKAFLKSCFLMWMWKPLKILNKLAPSRGWRVNKTTQLGHSVVPCWKGLKHSVN